METEQVVLQIVSEVLKLNMSEVTPEVEIGDLPGWDSIHHLTILCRLEDTFGVKFNQADLADCETVADLVDLIKEMSA